MPHRAKFVALATDQSWGDRQSHAHSAPTPNANHSRGRSALRNDNGRAFQANRWIAIGVSIAGLVLAACATTAPSSGGSATIDAAMPAVSSGAFRDLTPEEKNVIVEAVAPSLRNPTAAKYHWTKLSTVPARNGSLNYCATVDAQSPYAAYSGHQAYIIEVKLGFGGKVTSAVLGLIAGGKDVAIVNGMCAKYNLDPNSTT